MASDYRGRTPYEEHRDPNGRARPAYERLLTELDRVDLEQLYQRVVQRLADGGARFGDAPFVVDVVPRLLSAGEWDPLARGLTQRTRALNAFLSDAYGERRIVEAGIVAAESIDGAEGYEPELAGRLPAGSPPAPIIGFDLVRDPDGTFLVLEDNLRTPSGIAYLTAARDALTGVLPDTIPRPRSIDPEIYELLRAALVRAAPPNVGPNPQLVLVSDGPGNNAHYEHARLAAAIGVPIATLEQLHTDGERLLLRTADSELRQIDVVYRRTDVDRIRDEHGAMTPVAQTLVPAWLAGNLGLVNAFGNGVADDKLVHAHVEDFVRFYLGEEPLVRSVPTSALDSPESGADAIERLHELVVKPRHGHGGTGVRIGSQADEATLSGVRAELERHPERYIVQPIVPLSRHPTVIDGQLVPRHVDLRPFAFYADEVQLAPGGLSRVSFDEGEMIVNSSRNGGGKDTWVLDD
jgi:uncharacterized circularly permuted ATP-grasp superfamily protein